MRPNIVSRPMLPASATFLISSFSLVKFYSKQVRSLGSTPETAVKRKKRFYLLSNVDYRKVAF